MKVRLNIVSDHFGRERLGKLSQGAGEIEGHGIRLRGFAEDAVVADLRVKIGDPDTEGHRRWRG